MFISRGAPLFLTDVVDCAGGDGLRLVYGDERNEIVNLKFVTRGLILFWLSFFCPLKKCEKGNFYEGAGDFSVT